jgi:hypothetical protein
MWPAVPCPGLCFGLVVSWSVVVRVVCVWALVSSLSQPVVNAVACCGLSWSVLWYFGILVFWCAEVRDVC